MKKDLTDDRPSVLIILVTYNAEKWVDYCLSELPDNQSVHILCIDNASRDNTCTLVKNTYPHVELICSGENLGFGKANNIGLDIFVERGYEYAFLLNQDAKIDFDSLSKLVDFMCSNPEYGIISPVHRASNDTRLDQAFSIYASESSTPGLLQDLLLSNPLSDVYETTFVNAALWLISRRCVEEIGSFDPVFPHYGEDKDYVRRAREKGIKVGIAPSVYANHARDTKSEIESFENMKYRFYISLLGEYRAKGKSDLHCFLYFFRELVIEVPAAVLRLHWERVKMLWYGYSKIILFLMNKNIFKG